MRLHGRSSLAGGWWDAAGPAAAGCRTLGDDAGAALPQRPVAGQKRLRQGLRRLVPDVVVRGGAPRQDVLHALPGVHQLLPHLQVPNLVFCGKETCCLPLTVCKPLGPWLRESSQVRSESCPTRLQVSTSFCRTCAARASPSLPASLWGHGLQAMSFWSLSCLMKSLAPAWLTFQRHVRSVNSPITGSCARLTSPRTMR